MRDRIKNVSRYSKTLYGAKNWQNSEMSYASIFMILLRAQLKTREFEIMMWHYWNKLTFERIGRMQGCSKQAIEHVHRRVIIKLRKKKFVSILYL